MYIHIYVHSPYSSEFFFFQTSKLTKQDSLFENVYRFSHCKKRQTSFVAPVAHVIFMRCFQGRLQVKSPLTHPHTHTLSHTHTHTHTRKHIPAHLHIHLFSKHPTIFLTLLWHESAAFYFGNHPLIFPRVLLYTHTHTHTYSQTGTTGLNLYWKSWIWIWNWTANTDHFWRVLKLWN